MFKFLEYISDAFDVLYAIGGFILSLWWIWIPWFLFILAWNLWIKYIRNKHINEWEWVLLEIIPPRDIKKTPKVMEQFFAGLHGTHQSGLNWWDINMQGKTQKWFSFEIVSQGGDIHFFIRTISELRNLIESNIYAQYPEAEISQVDDYVNSVPTDIASNSDYNVWGTELILIKENAYPIRTYIDFEKDAVNEDQRIDPISTLLEVMSRISPDEQIWIQTIVRPIAHTWKDVSEKLRDELINRVKEKKQGLFVKEVIGWKEAGKGVAHQFITGNVLEGGSAENNKEDKRWESLIDPPTKSEKDIVDAIEGKASKHGFDTIIRFVYFAKEDIFESANIQAIVGAYKLFGTQHLNGFKPNSARISPTSIDYFWQLKKARKSYRRKRVFEDYIKRNFAQYTYSSAIHYLDKPLFFERWPILNWFFVRSQPFVFNTEELATVYHFPAEPVKTPLTPKVEAKKSEPPRGLPIG